MLPKQRVPFLKRRFIQRLAVLSGGLVGRQAIILVVSPILTRLYTPASSAFTPCSPPSTRSSSIWLSLRYELAVPVAQSDRDAAALACLALLAASACSLAGAGGLARPATGWPA